MPYHTTLRNERYAFADLREVFAKANEEKSGDRLAGIAADTDRERVAAKIVLADVRLGEMVDDLLYGCGDAVIGVNPVTESVDTVSAILRALDRLIEVSGAPTQACCLAHITTQLACLERGAPVDLLFQSFAGTEVANASFGITLSMLREGREKVLESHRHRPVRWVGDQIMYFETGQGSALSADAHQGVDQL